MAKPVVASHWYLKTAVSIPSASAISDVSTDSVRRTWGVPLMVGAPVGGLFGRGATATVAALVRLSALFASSVKETLTFMVLPSSASTRV